MAYGFAAYTAAYDTGRLIATGPDDVFGVISHRGRHFVELASRETGKPIRTILEPPFEEMARADGWTPRRLDGALTAGITRSGKAGYQWAFSWREACEISAWNRSHGVAA